MKTLPIPPMPTPEHLCKGWLCFMLSKDPDKDQWRDGLCPECLDELERDRIREELSASELEEIAREVAADSAMRDDKANRDEP